MARDYRELIGHDVVVQNPNVPDARWSGRAVAIAMDPSIVIELNDGRQLTFPLRWTALRSDLQQA